MDDFKTMYDASKLFIQGDFSFTKDLYFTNFSYQLGFVFIQGLFLKLIDSVLFLKIVNSIVTSLCVVFIFLIARSITSSRSGKIISLLYVFYFYPIYLNSVLTNQHLQSLFMLIIIYLIVKKDKGQTLDRPLVKSALIGILLGISNVIRSEAVVFLVSFILIAVVYLKKSNFKKIFLCLGTTIVSFCLFVLVANFSLQASHINDTGFKNNVPLWKFYVGLSVSHEGMYNLEDQNIFFGKSKEEQKNLLLERVQNDYLDFPILFLKKEIITFTKSDFNIQFSNHVNEKVLSILLYFSHGILVLVFCLLLLGIFPKGRTFNYKVLSLLIILFVYFGVYLFIEVSPRYGYNLQMILFILSSLGVDRLISWKKKQM